MADEFKPDWCLPPGAILREEMTARGATPISLMKSAPFPASLLFDVLEVRGPMTPQLAAWLERVWGTPASFWLRLESLWQEHRGAQSETEATDVT